MTARRYRRHDADVEAAQWTPADLQSVGSIVAWLSVLGVTFGMGEGLGAETRLHIARPGGVYVVAPGDWVVRERSGWVTTYGPREFEANYAPAEDDGLRERVEAIAKNLRAKHALVVTRGGLDADKALAAAAGMLEQALAVTAAQPGTFSAGAVQPAVVHASPLGDDAITPCCRRSPFELSDTHGMTNDPTLVTCKGATT